MYSDAKYIANAERGLKAIAMACGWKRLADADRDSFATYLESRKANGKAARTLKNETSTLTAFVLWAVEARRLDGNPPGRIMRIDQTGERKRIRRALPPDEGKLLRVAGPRALVYRVALGTGLRRRELQRLQWRDVRLDETRLTLRAEATKSKRADVLPLSADLVKRLREV